MKKRFITFWIATVMVTTLGIVFTGCETTKTSTSKKTETVIGIYSVFRTKDVQKYLSFLGSFDETKYEIEDISIRDHEGVRWYLITYKKIAE